MSNGDYPDVIGSANIEQSKGEMLQAQLLHAGEISHGRETLRVCEDGSESCLHMAFKSVGKPVSAPFTVK